MDKRIIKFRAWSNKDKLMLDWLCIRQSAFNRGETQLMYDVFTAPSFVDDCGFIPMQYTGLQDKNKVDIFEGDVVKCEYGTGAVVFHAGCFMIEWIDDKEANMEWLGMYHKPHQIGRPREDVEILGNLYQHPHLLTQTI